ncbi:hypothetical protein BIW11_00857 [Tropilaelaps mercedesae]|uniref:Uncharacterized protein n=1 Tax=Tropilaelaps mercedesae TaxID=418985 RepID=A0A1V9XNB6_9ACAR|nr:hypothetical protein BIW11_00857 [Tropilaelaps mercedesae]
MSTLEVLCRGQQRPISKNLHMTNGYRPTSAKAFLQHWTLKTAPSRVCPIKAYLQVKL